MTKKVSATELHKMLNEGAVKFQYEKNDGSIRTAVGTLKSDLIINKPSGGKCNPKDVGYSVYYDLEKEAFRCFAESKLIGIVEE